MLIPTAKNTRNITDFRKNPDSILEAVGGKSNPLYLFRGSEPKAVVLGISEYERLMEAEENYQDLLLISEILADPHRYDKGIPLEEVLKKYNINVDAEDSPSPKGRKKARSASAAR